MTNIFLRAEWRKLLMANYEIDRKVLLRYLPSKTELDFWNDICYVSLVGFMFQNTRIKGFKIPFHTDFEEVNLRFYVRHKSINEWKRGVVFVKEIVPKPALTFVANSVYKENYETMPMQHAWAKLNNELTVDYQWKKTQWNSLKVIASTDTVEIQTGSEEEFITEHYWGYTRLSPSATSQYQVEHPRWNVYPVRSYSIDVNFRDVYGPDFAFLEKQEPKSVFLAEGSEISVMGGTRI